MTPIVDAFMIVLNEEELIQYALESFASLGDTLGILSIVDNNSTDATLDIIERFRDRINIVLQHERRHSHHGNMRTMAMEPLTAPWIYYLDGDETFTSNFRNWLTSGQIEEANCWQFYKYSTIIDCYHHTDGGNGPTQRLFRNLPGRHFPQSIHTEPTHIQYGSWRQVANVYMFDHTMNKSREALWAKGWRYHWAFRDKVPAVGPTHEYINRSDDAFQNHADRNIDLPPEVRSLVFTGPGL